MKCIEVLYFAAAREKTGLTQEDFEWSDGLTLDGLLKQVLTRHPVLGPYMSHIRLAVDEAFVSEFDIALEHGQTVAFIPPVSGG